MLSLVDQADIVIPISKYLQRELPETAKAKSVVIPDGLDLERLHPTERLDDFVPGKTILHLGRIVPHRGIEYMLQALEIIKKEIPDVCLKLVGRETMPAYAAQIHKLAEPFGPSVQFVGFVPQGDIPKYYSSADIYLNCNLWDGSGTLPLEAQACGTPVVAFRIPAFRDFVKEGETGFLVEPKNYQQIAEKCIRLLKNLTLIAQMRPRCVALASEYSWDKIASKTIESYSALF